MLLRVENVLAGLPQTLSSYLSVAGTTGGTLQAVKNINGFTAQWAIQLGKTQEEQAEILNIDSVGGTVLNTSGTLRFNHPIDTPVYQIHYDKVIFARSTTGTAGTAVNIATVSITPDSQYTEYDDASGAATYAYQSQYYSSVTGDVSGTSDWFIPGGPSWYSLQRLRDRGKNALFNASFIKDDSTVNDWINEWIEQMTKKALKVNQAYSLGTAAYSFGTAGYGTVTEPLFKYASKIEITTDGITYTPSTELPVNRYSDADTFSSTDPHHSWQGDTTFRVLPYGNAGTVRMTLGKLATQLDSDGDELPQYLRGETANCIEYLLYRAKGLDEKEAVSDKHYQRFKGGQQEFVNEITPRDATGVKFIDMDGGLSGREEDMLIDTVF